MSNILHYLCGILCAQLVGWNSAGLILRLERTAATPE